VIIVSQGSGWMRGKELKKAVRWLTTARWNSVGLCCGGQLIEFLPRLDYTSLASYDIDKIMVRQSAYSTGDRTFEGEHQRRSAVILHPAQRNARLSELSWRTSNLDAR
jgi:hypothetical protein